MRPPSVANLAKLSRQDHAQHKQALEQAQQAVLQAGHPDNSLAWVMLHPEAVHAAFASLSTTQQMDFNFDFGKCANAVVMLFLCNQQWMAAAVATPNLASQAGKAEAITPYRRWLALATRSHNCCRNQTQPGKGKGNDVTVTVVDARQSPGPLGKAGVKRDGGRASVLEGGRWPAAMQAVQPVVLPLEEMKQFTAALQLDGVRGLVKPKTFESYTYKLAVLQRATGGESLAWLMQHPVETVAAMRQRTQNVGSIHATCAVITSMFRHVPRARAVMSEAWTQWHTIMAGFMAEQDKQAKASKLTAKQQAKVVQWQEVVDKMCELERAGAGTAPASFADHQEWLLMAVMVRICPKRSDLGQVHIVYAAKHDPEERKGTNYLLVKPSGMVLVITRHKTDDSIGPLVEDLPQELEANIRASLALFPRAFLFVSTKTKTAFASNHLYGQWFARTMGKHFGGRDMGVSLWRAVAERATHDYTNMTMEELEHRARLAGHSLATAQKFYRKVDLPMRTAKEMAAPVQCPATKTTSPKEPISTNTKTKAKTKTKTLTGSK